MALTTQQKIHLLITGNSTVGNVFSADELDFFANQADDDLYGAAAIGCRVMAADASKRALLFRSNGATIDRTSGPRHWVDLATSYEAKALSVPNEVIQTLGYDVDWAGQDQTEFFGEERNE